MTLLVIVATMKGGKGMLTMRMHSPFLSSKRQAGGDQYRGVVLPAGMRPELAEKLEKIIHAAMDDDPARFPLEIGISCFQAIQETLASEPRR